MVADQNIKNKKRLVMLLTIKLNKEMKICCPLILFFGFYFSSSAIAAPELKFNYFTLGYCYSTIDDTTVNYIEQSIKYNFINPLNFSFCSYELLYVLSTNEDLKRRYYNILDERLKNHLTDIDSKIEKREFGFFLNTLLKDSFLKNSFPADYKLIVTKLQNILKVPLKSCDYNLVLSKFVKADGGGVFEISDKLYSLLLIDCCDFIKNVEQTNSAKENYLKWINDIESMQFTALGDDYLSAKVIESKREYLLNEIKRCLSSPIKELTINLISNSKVRRID